MSPRMEGKQAAEDVHAETVDSMNVLYKAKLKEIEERKDIDSRAKVALLERFRSSLSVSLAARA